jgi:drug/metabolite transporter (DMT)-like permease
MQDHAKGILYAAITALCWAFLAIGLKIADRMVDSLTIVWIRFVIAFILLAMWQLYANPASFKLMYKPPLLLIIAAFGLSWNYYSFMLGIHYTTPSNAQLFIQLGPILLALAGFVFFKETIVRKQIIGFAISLVGMAFFYSDQLTAFFDISKEYNLGVIIIITSAVAWALYAILQKKLVARYSVDSLNLFLFGFPALIFLPMAKMSTLAQLNWKWWLLLFFLGANTFVAYTFMAKALKLIQANKVSIIIILNPILTFATMGILTWLNVDWIEHERFSIISILGAVIVLSGAILVVKRPKRKKQQIQVAG